MKKNPHTTLLIIDAQLDFCSSQGALYVPGAEQDMERLTALIDRSGLYLNRIVATLDVHPVLHIAHPGFWIDAEGRHPAPFTPISYAQIKAGRWQPLFEAAYAQNYVRQLEEQGEFSHFIWPEHCLAGTQGAALLPVVARSLRAWTLRTGLDYDLVAKGIHPLAEHFGVFRAQIPVPGVVSTALNQTLLDQLAQSDALWLAGEARSHCVGTSLDQILRYAPALAPSITLLTDCTSDVTGMGHLAEPIYERARAAGVAFRSSDTLLL